jgi:hypothetical protein
VSVAVDLDALWKHVDEFGTPPYLVTTAADGRPHVVSVAARVDDGRFVLGAGNTTRANVAANPTATLLWGAPAGADYCLIVDGQAAELDGELVAIQPTRAVLHRVAGASADLPSCVAI